MPPGYRQRIWLKLTVWLVGCLAFFTSLAVLLASQEWERGVLRQMTLNAAWFAETVKLATRFAMLKDQRDSVQAVVEAVARQEGVETINILNKQGRIVFSNHPEAIGDQVTRAAEGCRECHGPGAASGQAGGAPPAEIVTVATRSGEPGRILGVTTVIANESACYRDPCHAHQPEQRVLGVMQVGLSLAHLDRQLRENMPRLLGLAMLFSLLIAVALGLVSHRLLNRPLAGLLRSTRRIAGGDYLHEVVPASRDELGELAHALDQMRQGIKSQTEALEESRRRFQTLFEQVPCYISVQDRELRLVAVNRMFARDFGRKIGELCYRAYKGREDRCPHCAVEKSFADGRVHSSEQMVRHPDGSVRHFLNFTAPITDAFGNIVAVMEMSTDVTELRRLEEELRRSEEKYRLFFNGDPNAIFVLDRADLAILDANRRAALDYGRPLGELLGASFVALAEPGEQARLAAFLDGEGSSLPRLSMLRADGGIMMVNLRASYGEHLGRQAVIAVTADISETLKAEEQLIQAAKMATLGEMSAGVAHELNQPLSVLATAGRVLGKALRPDRPIGPEVLAEVAGEIGAQVERAARIIGHLREFGRKAEVTRGAVDLAQAIGGVFQLLGQQCKLREIEVTVACPPDLPRVWGERLRLEQVFLNLVLNARDAIEEARRQGPRPGRIAITARAEGEWVAVRVADDGAGIPPELRDRIFEPFFTTKEVGKGTGLGLSISYGIIRDYGGELSLESRAGEAETRFLIRLPQAREEAA